MPNGGNGAVRQRINFSKIPTVIKIPNLIEVQRRSYERFLQMSQGKNPDQEFQARHRAITIRNELKGH